MSSKADVERMGKQVMHDLGQLLEAVASLPIEGGSHSCHHCGSAFPLFDHLQEHRENVHGEEEAA